MVMEAMLVDGLVVPLLGAGVNLCGRPPEAQWRAGEFLPDGKELASLLARKVPEYPSPMLTDLLRASQCVHLKRGWKALYLTLHGLLDADYPPTMLHHVLARVPRLMAVLERPPRETHLLFVSTNYDDVLERALDEAGEPYDLVWYVARGEHVGKFMHTPPGGSPRVIEDPSEYVEPLDLTERSVVLKIHGAVDRAAGANGESGANDSYVITEDNYIEYLTRTDIRKLIPKGLVGKLRNSSILFLGYSLRDWNLRAIFHRIWQEEKLGLKSWAIRRPLQPLPPEKASIAEEQETHRQKALEEELEEAFWNERGVEIFDEDLAVYTQALAQAASDVTAELGVR
jgi:hypothetical protein